MRDGVVLRADVWRPAGQGRHPTLVYRTPYGKAETSDGELVAKAVTRGYAVVVQDVRGRYASGGDFSAYTQEGKDGFDTIEWAAAQPWSSGQHRHLRPVVPRRGPVAGRDRVAAAPRRDGAGDDLRYADALLVHGRGLGRVMAGLDLAQHRPRPAPPGRHARAADRRAGARGVEGRGRDGAGRAAAHGDGRLQGRGRVVLRVDAPSALRPVVELGGADRQVRPRVGRGAQPQRLARRDVRARRRHRELRRAGRVARWAGARGAHAGDRRSLDPR